MKNIQSKHTGGSIPVALCFFGALCSVAHGQTGTCAAVQAAYNKTFSSGANMATKNGPGVNVTQAQAAIT